MKSVLCHRHVDTVRGLNENVSQSVYRHWDVEGGRWATESVKMNVALMA